MSNVHFTTPNHVGIASEGEVNPRQQILTKLATVRDLLAALAYLTFNLS